MPDLDSDGDGDDAPADGGAAADRGGAADDDEAEADRLAAAVLLTSGGGTTPPPLPPPGDARNAVAPNAGAAPGPPPPRPPRPGGNDLGTLRRPLEALTGVNLATVRVHYAPHLARTLGARAFFYGADIFLGHGASSRVVAHEGAHAAQQAAAGRAGVQRWMDPTQSSLSPAELYTWNDFDIVMGIEVLFNHLEPTDLDDSERESGIPNLGLLIDAAMARRIDLGDNLLSRLPASAAPKMPAATPCSP